MRVVVQVTRVATRIEFKLEDRLDMTVVAGDFHVQA